MNEDKVVPKAVDNWNCEVEVKHGGSCQVSVAGTSNKEAVENAINQLLRDKKLVIDCEVDMLFNSPNKVEW